jgi:hypothetical protein
MSDIGSQPAFPPQKMFDAIKAGDEALRAKLNRAAAESDGWKYSRKRREWTPPPDKLIPDTKYVWPPDYTQDLNAVAGLKLPEKRGHKYWITIYTQSCVEYGWNGSDDPSIVIGCVRYADPADEALARLCCLAVAGGWKV